MSMTDDEARDWIKRAMSDCAEHLGHGCAHCQALDHALQAIADRAELCDAIYAYGVDAGVSANRTRNSARRHMKGEAAPEPQDPPGEWL
jgi:hypothetical protein